MKIRYNKNIKEINFRPGDKVLVFLSVPCQPLQARYLGHYAIERKISETDYIVLKRLCHINILKEYHERKQTILLHVLQLCQLWLRMNKTRIIVL